VNPNLSPSHFRYNWWFSLWFQNPHGTFPPLNHAGVFSVAVVNNNNYFVLSNNVIYSFNSLNLTNLLWNKNNTFKQSTDTLHRLGNVGRYHGYKTQINNME
jgi:hypothetical protein